MSEILNRMLADAGQTREDFDRAQANGSKFVRASVPMSAELRRILALPRRSWEEDAPRHIEALTQHLRAPGGTQTLRPVQAASLIEMHDFKGMLGVQRVGAGKCTEFDTEVFDVETGSRRLVGDTGAVCVVAMREGTGRFGLARGASFASGRKECFELVLANGMSLRASFDHPVFTARGWVWMRDLREDDLVATARQIPDPVKVTQATDDEVKFAAYLIADGGVSQAHTIFCDDSAAVLGEVRALSDALAGGTGHERDRGGVTEEFAILGALERLAEKPGGARLIQARPGEEQVAGNRSGIHSAAPRSRTTR